MGNDVRQVTQNSWKSQISQGSGKFSPTAEQLLTMARKGSKKGALEDSIQLYEKLLALFPRSAEVREALFEVGEIYTMLVRISPSKSSKQLRSMKSAAARLQAFAEQYPHSTKAPHALILIASAYECCGQIPLALTIYQKVAARYSSSPWVVSAYRGIISLCRQDHLQRDAAIKKLEQLSASQDPRIASSALNEMENLIVNNILHIFSEKEKTFYCKKLLPILKSFIGQHPNDRDRNITHRTIMECLEHLGHYQEVLDYYAHAHFSTSAYPPRNDPDLRSIIQRSEMLVGIQSGDFQKGFARLKSHVEKNGGMPPLPSVIIDKLFQYLTIRESLKVTFGGLRDVRPAKEAIVSLYLILPPVCTRGLKEIDFTTLPISATSTILLPGGQTIPLDHCRVAGDYRQDLKRVRVEKAFANSRSKTLDILIHEIGHHFDLSVLLNQRGSNGGTTDPSELFYSISWRRRFGARQLRKTSKKDFPIFQIVEINGRRHEVVYGATDEGEDFAEFMLAYWTDGGRLRAAIRDGMKGGHFALVAKYLAFKYEYFRGKESFYEPGQGPDNKPLDAQEVSDCYMKSTHEPRRALAPSGQIYWRSNSPTGNVILRYAVPRTEVNGQKSGAAPPSSGERK